MVWDEKEVSVTIKGYPRESVGGNVLYLNRINITILVVILYYIFEDVAIVETRVQGMWDSSISCLLPACESPIVSK